MLEELQAIVAARCVRKPAAQAMLARFGKAWRAEAPRDVRAFASAYCAEALPLLRRGDDSAAGLGADLLLQFLADLPAEVASRIDAVADFAPAAARAWLEPVGDAFVALSCTVHDVWAHLLGPESQEDELVLGELLRHAPSTAFDFGCGAGHFAHALARHGVDVEGAELDPVKAAFFRYRARHADLAQRMRLQPDGAAVDLVLAINVLDHLEEPAEAVELLAQRLRPGGRLCVLAAFPNDGWHQNDPDAVARCGQSLWRRFEPAPGPPCAVPWMERFAWRRQPSGDSLERRHPCLHPAARLEPAPSGGHHLVTPSPYALPCHLNDDAAELCRHLDGSRSVAALARILQIDAAELDEFCDYLHTTRQLYWRTSGAEPVSRPEEAQPC